MARRTPTPDQTAHWQAQREQRTAELLCQLEAGVAAMQTGDDFTRYLDTVLDCFGSERLLFGSDWPVCTLSGEYAEVVLLLQQYVRGLSIEDQERIFGSNAAQFYALPTEVL